MPRRVKVLAPESAVLSVRRAKGSGWEADGQVAPGMERGFVVSFRPETPDSFAYDLVVCTQREKFVVPVVALGRATAVSLRVGDAYT